MNLSTAVVVKTMRFVAATASFNQESGPGRGLDASRQLVARYEL
jgi:hypothetical protein